MKVLGISGSPVKGSNTDRALKVALKATGMDTEFIKLSDYKVEPCRACKGCIETNRCVIEDDGIMLAEKVRVSDALIIAGTTPYSSLDGRTKAFMERLYPLRHRYGYLAGKPGGAIVTCAVPEGNAMLPPACDNGLDAIRFFMMEEGMTFAGAVKILGNIPCMWCEFEDRCRMSAVRMIFGPNATPETVEVHRFEAQPRAMETAKKLGNTIAGFLRSKN